jgi:hypothetical protein
MTRIDKTMGMLLALGLLAGVAACGEGGTEPGAGKTGEPETLTGEDIGAETDARDDAAAAMADAASVRGTWRGRLDLGGASLRLEVRIAEAEAGAEAPLSAELTSLDQGNAVVEGTGRVEDGAVRLSFPPAAAGMTIPLPETPDAETLDATFTQGGRDMPVELSRGGFAEDPEVAAREAALREAREAAIPFESEMTVEAPDATLAGTFRVPSEGEGPFPAVVLISGSGPQDRDMTIGPHKMFAVLADALAAEGIASLRLDDRGVGQSEPAPAAGPRALSGDMAAALSAVRSREDTAPACAGYVGISEGATMAVLAAEDAADPQFLVALAPPVGSMRTILEEQAAAILRASGGTEEQVERNRELQATIFAAMESGGPDGAAAEIERVMTEAGAAPGVAQQQAQIWGQPYAVAALDLDPAAAYGALEAPVLAYFAEKDLQVLPGPNAERLRQAREGLPTEIVTIDGVNHLFQTAETGLPGEYATAPHAIAPQALETIVGGTAALVAESCS